MSTPRLNVVLYWHMHQPTYRLNGRYALPWVYLHAIKDYTDMVAHVETTPGARAVFNFVPVLLEQIEHYAGAVKRFLQDGSEIPDALLDALARDGARHGARTRAQLIRQCLNVNERHVLGRFPAFARLAALARQAGDDAGRYLDEGYLTDLLVWFHLAWLGEHVRRDDDRVRALIHKERAFDAADRRTLMVVIGSLLDTVLARYRTLADAGRIELSVSPQTHAMLPLLIDFASMREAQPHATLPGRSGYPGGAERADWQLAQAQRCFERIFGAPAYGCWPSEGGISREAVARIARAGFRWTVSGGAVLANSLAAGGQSFECVHRPYLVDGVSCFFRDDGLSDLIGFSYKDWQHEDAVANLMGHLETIARHCGRDDAVVVIVLDGENAWESYPANAFDFLRLLYRGLADHPALELTTFRDYLAAFPNAATELGRVVAGSWVYGTLSTWIGHADKNRAWELLCDAKARFDARRASLANVAECEELLAACEGSDWFWWFGDDNATTAVAEFDALFRAHLAALYAAMGEPIPDVLSVPLSRGSDTAIAHTMRSS